MQLCALNSEQTLVFANKATKHTNYKCRECGQNVRVRGGIHRQPHYYHLQPNRACKQHSKGMAHLMLQQFLKKQLPEGEVELEHRFPEIGRIADVAWIPKRLIYEIQCSPITSEEIEKRNASYAAIGYQVVWIFHDSRYNQVRLTAAENTLLNHPHYFSNMNAMGEGKIYDQFAIFRKGKRAHRLPKTAVDLSSPYLLSIEDSLLREKLPNPLFEKIKLCPLVFCGDSIDRCLKLDEAAWKEFENQVLWKQEIEALFQRTSRFFRAMDFLKWGCYRWIVLPYLSLLRLFLERACR